MKKGIISIITIFIVLLIIAFFLFFFASGIKKYNSKLSNIEMDIPKSSFNIREYQDDGAYTIMWNSIRNHDNVKNEIEKIYNSNYPNFTIIDWGYNNEDKLIKEYFILYEVN